MGQNKAGQEGYNIMFSETSPFRHGLGDTYKYYKNDVVFGREGGSISLGKWFKYFHP